MTSHASSSTRRNQNVSGDSNISQTSSLQENIRLTFQLEGQLESLTLNDIHEETETARPGASSPTLETAYDAITFLGRALSTHSLISTSSSLAERYAAAQEVGATTQNFICIGSGQCGSVFAYPGDPWVVKRANASPLPLWTEYIMHKKVRGAAKEHPDVAAGCAIIPEPKCYITPEIKAWWKVHLPKFPQDYRTPANVLVSSYIMPLPEPVRFALIDQFCPEDMRDLQIKSPGNRDCLARVYLGKKSNPRPSRFFTLRNFALYHDRMELLGMDLFFFVERMARTMALMHFGASIDGRDVEFVLGSRAEPTESSRLEDVETLPPCTTDLSPTASVEPGPLNYCRRRVELFVLDFNQCRPITMTEEGMKTAAEAFVINDPYCPRPHHADEDVRNLWVYFIEVYRNTAFEVAGLQLGKERTGELVDWFLQSVDTRVRVRQFIGLGTG